MKKPLVRYNHTSSIKAYHRDISNSERHVFPDRCEEVEVKGKATEKKVTYAILFLQFVSMSISKKKIFKLP